MTSHGVTNGDHPKTETPPKVCSHQDSPLGRIIQRGSTAGGRRGGVPGVWAVAALLKWSQGFTWSGGCGPGINLSCPHAPHHSPYKKEVGSHWQGSLWKIVMSSFESKSVSSCRRTKERKPCLLLSHSRVVGFPEAQETRYQKLFTLESRSSFLREDRCQGSQLRSDWKWLLTIKKKPRNGSAGTIKHESVIILPLRTLLPCPLACPQFSGVPAHSKGHLLYVFTVAWWLISVHWGSFRTPLPHPVNYWRWYSQW